jgi:intracellular septation protein
MKVLFDIFPVILFFVMFKWGDSNPGTAQSLVDHYMSAIVSGGGTGSAAQAPIMLATAIAIIATFGQIIFLLLRHKKVDAMLWVSLVIITVFGGATIYFHDETFIKWKPTVLYWVFGTTLFFSQMLFSKNLIRMVMEEQISLPYAIWQRLNLAWALFFIAMGLINLYVAYNFTLATWVNFKLFGFTGLMFAFVIAQSVFLSKYVKDSR